MFKRALRHLCLSLTALSFATAGVMPQSALAQDAVTASDLAPPNAGDPTPLAPAPAPVMPTPVLTPIQAQGVARTLMAYPTQADAILQNYIGIDTTKIDLDALIALAESQQYDAVYDEVTLLATHRDAFNAGTFTAVRTYKVSQTAVAASAETAPETGVQTPLDTDTAQTVMPVPADPVPVPVAEASSDPVTATEPPPEAAPPASPSATSLTSRLLNTPTLATLVGVGVAAAVVGSSSGGGGSAGGSSPGTTPGATADVFARTALPDLYPASNFTDSEFGGYNLNALSASNAQYAYAKGLTGQGVTIGFHDFFANDASSNTELNSRIGYRSLNIAADSAILNSEPDCVNNPGLLEACNHGVAVMQYAAAARNGSGSMGMAYQANLLMNSVNAPTTSAVDLGTQGADIINFSCGGCATASELHTLVDSGVFITAATGNDDDGSGGAEPDPFSPAAIADEFDYSLIGVTGAFDVGGILLNPYDHCGPQMNYCMTALSDIGTSFAAPQVAGAAALLKDGWGYLTAKQIGQILLASARDLGDPGVDPVFGHGLLNVQAAVSPIGAVTFLSGSGLSSFAASRISQNQASAFGNAFAANAGRPLTVIDAFGRDFAVTPRNSLNVAPSYRLSATTLPVFGTTPHTARTMRVTDALSLHFNQQPSGTPVSDVASYAAYDVTPATQYRLGFATDINAALAPDTEAFNRRDFVFQRAFQNGFLNFSDNDQVFHQSLDTRFAEAVALRLTTVYSKNSQWDYFNPTDRAFNSDFAASLVDTHYSPADGLDIGFTNGVTHEFQSVLGTQTTGAFDMGSGANTYFTGLDMAYDATADWNLSGSYRVGRTQVAPSARSAFTAVSDLLSDSFALTATRHNLWDHDRFSLSVAQPLRVRSGTARGVTQVVDHATGAVGTTGFTQDLVPTGRTLQLQAAYQKDLGTDIGVNLALGYESQPYQDRAARNDASALVKVVYRLP